MNGAGWYIASSLISGAIGGAIGAAAGEGSDHPVIKGAIITGLVSGALGAVAVALASDPKPLGVSGVGQLRSEWRLP